MYRIAVMAVLSTFAFPSIGYASPVNHCNDQPEPGWPDNETLVKNSKDAIRIAFAEWGAANPQVRSEDEKLWETDFTATLHECVWEVAEKPEPPRNYSTFVIRIGARDGRFLGAIVSD